LERLLKPEWLDELPASDPAAIRSRQDLRRVNMLMGHAAIAARALNATDRHPESLLEIGAGDGNFMLRVIQRFSRIEKRRKVTLLDQQNILSAETRNDFASVGWEVETSTTDLFDWIEISPAPCFDAILANLFLHHFSENRLRHLFERLVDRCEAFIAIEPRRAVFPFVLSHGLGLVGCNRVTRHDAVVSVGAGFTGSELSLLWPSDLSWTLHEGPAGLFSHLFTAHRKGATPKG
jgi:phospholipid N-methyltransferase